MGLFTKFKAVWEGIADSAIDATASILNTSGSIACAAGGIGFAVAQGMNKTFSLSYYGNASGFGGLAVQGTVEHTTFGFNYTLPISVEGTQNGENTYKVTDYADPGLVLMASSVCVGGGLLLKSLGNSLKTWQQYRYDERYNKFHYNTSVPAPSMHDFLLVNTRSVLDSLTIATLSHSIMSCVVSYSNLFNSSLRVTFPFSSPQSVNGTYYNGPVASGSYPIDFKLDPQEVTIKVPYIGDETVLLNMEFGGVANVTYGGGLFFKVNNPTPVPPVVSQTLTAIGGVSAYLAGNFFSRKERYKRDNVLQIERVKEYSTIQNEHIEVMYTS